MPYAEFPYNGLVEPARFRGRKELINAFCDHYAVGGNVSFVGGPFTGGDSLVRYIASENGRQRYPRLNGAVYVYLAAADLGGGADPAAFWRRVFHELDRRLPGSEVPKDMKAKAHTGEIDVYELEDAFDALAGAGNRVVLCVSDLHLLLENRSFLPPSDFFHIARSLARRDNRGVRFVTTSPRPLLDLWDRSRNASPFYNIFQTFAIGRLEEHEVREAVTTGFDNIGVPRNDAVVDFVLATSERHPMVFNYVASLCADFLLAGEDVSQDKLQQHFARADSPVVSLVRRILSHLTPIEKQWIHTARHDREALSDNQRAPLRNLWEYGLTPPGVSIA